MLCCRVCRTENNLKYTKQEIRKQRTTGKRRQQFINNAAQLGNICFDCDLRLQTYHQVQDSESELDVDGTVVPIIPKLPHMADDVLMYQQFVANVKKSQKFINDLNIVEVVDLSLDSETEQEEKENLKLLQNCTPNLVTHPHELPTNEKKRRKRKRYDENEFRLLASFSLVSSDSEVEDRKPETIKNSTPKETAKVTATKAKNNFNNNNNNNNDLNLTYAPPEYKCDKCTMTYQDFESLVIHRQVHNVPKLNCPACEHVCITAKRLINHMRCKHRTYQSTLLTERPRCSQDSAMTIRLRYREHDIYYECQLCGRIDDVFKQHKEHILKEHADESKQLGDPISPPNSRKDKTKLKRNSSIQNCPVCKHDCGPDRTQLAKHMASKHQLSEYKSHLRQIFKVEKYKSQIVQIRKIKKTARLFKVIRTQCLLFQCRQCDDSVQLNCNDHLNHVKTHQQSKLRSRKFNELEKQNQIKSQGRSDTMEANIIKDRKISKSLAEDPKELKKQRRVLLKEEKLKKKLPKVTAAAVLKVKVKPPPRSIPLQQCFCKYCNKICNSFLCLNRHLLAEHCSEEYCTCAKCDKSFNSEERLKQHECEPLTHQHKRKRLI